MSRKEGGGDAACMPKSLLSKAYTPKEPFFSEEEEEEKFPLRV